MQSGRYTILFVLTQGLDPNAGGVQMSTCKLGRFFSQSGHKVGVFSFARDGHVPIDFGELWAGRADGGHSSAVNRLALEAVLDSFAPDIVINQMPYEREIGDLLKKRKRFLLLGCLRNTLFSVKGNLESYVRRAAPGPLKRLSRSRILQQLFLSAHRKHHRANLLKILDTYDHFVMFGQPNLEELRFFVPEFKQDKIRLIPNSIPKVLDSVPYKEKRLLWLGRVAHDQKRAELVLHVWERVSKALPDWGLDVVGEGPLLQSMKADATKKGLVNIHFHGRQAPNDYFRRAAIFFMTSAFEGFPNTLVEAQSFGAIPVIFDSYPVASWIVQDGKNGFLIYPFDVDAMAERIVALAKDPSRSKLAQRSLESAQRFHIDRVGEMWQRLFESSVPKYIDPGRPKKVV
jgi:glycosyltransferase involved in cell wall biosynthesis